MLLFDHGMQGRITVSTGWGGAQRWLRSPVPPAQVWATAAAAHGHATLMRGVDRSGGVFHPVSAAQASIERRLKAELDPAGVFGCGRAVR